MKNKYIVGGFIIIVFLGLMGYLFTKTNISYENNFAKVMSSHKTTKATGSWDKAKSYKIDKQRNLFIFFLKDNDGREMKIVYKGTMPNNFESATSVVVTGKYKNGYFHATDILTKCPSKYEQEYKQKPSNSSSNS